MLPLLAAAMALSAQASDWTSLFDGTHVTHWRGYRSSDFPSSGWAVRDGCLTHLGGQGGGDLVTRAEYGSFELELEWRVAPGANSGVFYLVTEDQDAAWMTGPEMQVLDDSRHPDGANPLTSAGALYGLIPPGPGKALAPVGEFNHARLVVRGDEVEHWLNGALVVAYRLDSAEWRDRVAASKFAALPRYGKNRRGRIALQDHWDEACFRSIRIRELR